MVYNLIAWKEEDFQQLTDIEREEAVMLLVPQKEIS